MSTNINNLLQDSQAQFAAQRNQTKGLVTKWEATGLLEGIGKEYDKHNTAILLENQAKQLISESNAIATDTNRENWNGVALPLVRRIFAEISAKEFVSVQPMNLPSGLVFWLDFRYAGSAGTGKGRHANGDSLFAAAGKDKADLTGGLYGAFSSSLVGEAAGFSLAKVKVAVSNSSDLVSGALDIAGNQSFVDAPTEVDYDLAGAFYVISSSGAVFTASAYDGSTSVTFNLASGAGTAMALPGLGGDLFYYRNTTNALNRGDFEDTVQPEIDAASGDLEIPELDVQLTQEALVAKTRKLKVKWSPEFAQDLNAYHSIDAEAELTSMLSEYISMEIDLEILSMLTLAAKTSGFTSNFKAIVPSAGEKYGDAFGQLGIAMQAMSNAIHRSTMRGGANFAVCSPQIATYLESMAGYTANTTGEAAEFAMGVSAIGSLSNRFTIYKNPYWTGDDILLGFKGNQFLETGAVFAPYIPLIMTPLVYDPTNFTPRKGVMTRYAKKVVRNDFYGAITVNDNAWSSSFGLPS